MQTCMHADMHTYIHKYIHTCMHGKLLFDAHLNKYCSFEINQLLGREKKFLIIKTLKFI